MCLPHVVQIQLRDHHRFQCPCKSLSNRKLLPTLIPAPKIQSGCDLHKTGDPRPQGLTRQHQFHFQFGWKLLPLSDPSEHISKHDSTTTQKTNPNPKLKISMGIDGKRIKEENPNPLIFSSQAPSAQAFRAMIRIGPELHVSRHVSSDPRLLGLWPN